MASSQPSDPTHEPTPATGASPGAPPPLGRPHRRWVVPLGAVVAAAVLVFAGLVVTGVVPLGKTPSASPPFAPTFQGAASLGQPTADGNPGGPWGPSLGIAFRVPFAVTVPTSNLTQSLPSSGGCNATLVPGLAKDVVVQATPASAGPGESAFWIVLYVNSTSSAVGIMVDGGASSEVFSLLGASCASLASALVPFPGGSPDSPEIINAVNASGGSSFLSAHPGATEVFLGASVILLQPLWGVVFTTCTLSPVANSSGYEFNATVVGTTVQSTHGGPVTCSLPSGSILPVLTAAFPGPSAVGKAI